MFFPTPVPQTATKVDCFPPSLPSPLLQQEIWRVTEESGRPVKIEAIRDSLFAAIDEGALPQLNQRRIHFPLPPPSAGQRGLIINRGYFTASCAITWFYYFFFLTLH